MAYTQPTPDMRPEAQPEAEPEAESLETLERKLAAANAQLRRYETRLFAYERAMLALRRENDRLEALCAQAEQGNFVPEPKLPSPSLDELGDLKFTPPTLPEPPQSSPPPAQDVPQPPQPEEQPPEPAEPSSAVPGPDKPDISDIFPEPELPPAVPSGFPEKPNPPEKPTHLDKLSADLLEQMARMMGC